MVLLIWLWSAVHYIPIAHLSYKWKYICGSSLPFFLLPASCSITTVSILSIISSVLDFTYKWDNKVFIFVWFISFSIMPWVHPRGYKWTYFLLSNGWIIVGCFTPHVIYPFSIKNGGIVSSDLDLHSVLTWTRRYRFFGRKLFISSWYNRANCLSMKELGSFKFFGTTPHYFHSGCTKILHFHQQCMSFSFLNMLTNIKASLVFLILAILTGVGWHLVNLISSSYRILLISTTYIIT